MNGRLTGHGSLSGGLTGGIGGVSDYNELENLPIMNSKTIEGNHDGHYYGLANLSDIPEPYTPPNYSTNEINTGVKWIDGKDIYQKTYNTITMSSTSVTIDTISIDTLIDAKGIAMGTGKMLVLPYSDGEDYGVLQYVNGNLIYSCSRWTLNNVPNITITIQYTKV
jgi:hypothetical protein